MLEIKKLDKPDRRYGKRDIVLLDEGVLYAAYLTVEDARLEATHLKTRAEIRVKALEAQLLEAQDDLEEYSKPVVVTL